MATTISCCDRMIMLCDTGVATAEKGNAMVARLPHHLASDITRRGTGREGCLVPFHTRLAGSSEVLGRRPAVQGEPSHGGVGTRAQIAYVTRLRTALAHAARGCGLAARSSRWKEHMLCAEVEKAALQISWVGNPAVEGFRVC
jgi:hypothetical protein